MFFNSIEFALFLPIVFILFWFAFGKSIKLQNVLILVASYVFYGWWDWRFLGLVLFSSVADYIIGQKMELSNSKSQKKRLLITSMTINLGLLIYFKYSNFFIDSFISSAESIGLNLNWDTLDIILPVGISFYTFQTMSYTIDIYREKLKASKDPIAFFAFVSFFPQLVAGPIERATHLLPQFSKKRTFDYNNAINGLRQILWGLFKKVVIADSCAHFANMIFDNYSNQSGSTLVLGALFFTFQIYGDFSGYSDIAIGTSRLFGFDLMKNFAFPYFSRDIAEFWRRWHISLSTWFRDYLYIPLGGSKGGNGMRIRNTFIIFLVSGFWHGANWTFIVWGLLNALYFLPVMLSNRNRQNIGIIAEGKYLPTFRDGLNMFLTFVMAVFAWIFFRADNISIAFDYISRIFNVSILDAPQLYEGRIFVFLIFFVIVEWFGREGDFALDKFTTNWNKIPKYGFYYQLIALIFIFKGQEQEFIYFQF